MFQQILSIMSNYTTPIYPGYTWILTPTGWIMQYNPIPGVYSPPVLHQGINKGYFYYFDQYIPIMGSLIGKNGFHYKNITRLSESVYIYNINDTTVEIWGTDKAISKAIILINKHIKHVVEKLENKKQDSSESNSKK